MLSMETVFACFNGQSGRLNIEGSLALEAMVGGFDGISPA